MWILLLVVLTSDGQIVPYEQGIYESFAECYDVKEAMILELNDAYRATCLEW